MGSRHWFKNLIRRKKRKDDKSGQSSKPSAEEAPNGSTHEISSQNDALNQENGTTNGMNIENVAAIHIQTAYRAYKARKTLQRMKGAKKLQILLKQGPSVRNQSLSTLTHLHTWGRIQSQIKERRLYMVTEGRLKQKKLENQLKLEAKLHDLEVEWCNGLETMEEILARIHQREEAAVKRERALAYAFSHQWRANSSLSQGLNASEVGKANWGWSWKERWIAARPWESRVTSPSTDSSNKGQNKPAVVKAGKNVNALTTQNSGSTKSAVSNGKEQAKARRSSFPGAQRPPRSEAKTKAQEAGVENGTNGSVLLI